MKNDTKPTLPEAENGNKSKPLLCDGLKDRALNWWNGCKYAHEIYFNDYIKTNYTKANTSWGLLTSEIVDIYISAGGK
jgi:hypothetical protein